MSREIVVISLDGAYSVKDITTLNIYIRHQFPISAFFAFFKYFNKIFPPTKYTTGIINNCLKEVKGLEGLEKIGGLVLYRGKEEERKKGYIYVFNPKL